MIVFLASFAVDPTVGVELVLFMWLAQLGQEPIISSLFIQRLLHYYVDEGSWRIFWEINNHAVLTLSVLIPSLIAISLHIASEVSKDPKVREKFRRKKEFVLVEWTYAAVMFHIYGVVAALTSNMQGSSDDSTFELATRWIFVWLPCIFEALSQKRGQEEQRASCRAGRSEPAHRSGTKALMFLLEVYLLPLFLSIYELTSCSLPITLSLLVLRLLCSLPRVLDCSKMDKCKVLVSRGAEILIFTVYVAVQISDSHNLRYSYAVYDLVSSCILILLIVNLIASIIYLLLSPK